MKKWIIPGGVYPRLYKNILAQSHIIIAGATGSGKSVIINGLIYTALYNSPGQVQLILIDPKKVELADYKRLPHCTRYADTPRGILEALQAAEKEMDSRFSAMQRCGEKLFSGGDLYIVIDEFADLMTTQRRETLPILCRLAQLGRAARVHLILATQRPTRDIINGQIQVNIAARLALRCPSKQDSRNIIGTTGAELLPRYGRGLYLTPEYFPPVPVDIPMIPQADIQRIIAHWEKQKPRLFPFFK